MKNRFASALIAVVLVAPALFAAEDLTGKWGGTFIITVDANPPHDDVVHMVATQKGAELTGTIGPNADEQMVIAGGKIVTAKEDGKEITKAAFDVSEPGSGAKLHFELTLVAGHLKGTAKGSSDGHNMTVAVDMARLK